MEQLNTLDVVEAYLDRDVVNGQEYLYSLRAVNEMAAGDTTPVVAARPTGPPTVPLNVTATASDGSVKLTWSPPENDGGYPVRQYVIMSGDSPDALGKERMVLGQVLHWVDPSVENGVARWYTVIAENELGRGPRGSVVNATPMGPPGVPRSIRAAAGDRQATVSWEPPVDDGGAEIEGYNILRGATTRDLLPLAEVGPGVTSHTDVGLENGVTYYYSVQAWNVVGGGPHAEIVEVKPLPVPLPPTHVSIEAMEGFLILGWAPPENVAAVEVVQYIVYRGTTEDGLYLLLTVAGSTREYRDVDVDAGVTYFYSVSAVTGMGEGPMTKPVSAIPFGPPGAPQALRATAGDREVTLSWEPPPDDGASPVIGYTVLRGSTSDILVDLETVGTVTSFIDPMVNNGVTYHYAVVAINDAGPGVRSASVNVTPTRPPDTRPPWRVTTLVGTVVGGSVVLQWEAPNGPDAPPVNGYLVLRGETPEDLTLAATLDDVRTWTDGSVEPANTYHYVVIALNGAIEGESSDPTAVEVPEIVDKGGCWGVSSILAVAAIVAVFGLVISFSIIRERRGSS
jgi:hypothetical protein